MKLFLFNEIIPNTISTEEIIIAFKNTVIEYKKIKETFEDSIDGIVSSGELNGINLHKTLTLANCLNLIDNKEIKEYSYSIFTKYPIDNFADSDVVLEEGKEHYFLLDDVKKDALYVKIISTSGGVLFTLNLHERLANNTLVINCESDVDFSIDNLFGNDPNTEYIKQIINNDELAKLGNFDRLKRILGEPVISNKFKNSFSKLSKEIQDIIIDGFITMIQDKNHGRNTSETLLKDVTPAREVQINIKELKIRDPIAKRIYFSENGGVFYLASLENKPLKDRLTTEQSLHIKAGISTLKQLMQL